MKLKEKILAVYLDELPQPKQKRPRQRLLALGFTPTGRGQCTAYGITGITRRTAWSAMEKNIKSLKLPYEFI